ncbi:MAG: hypothetical protein PHO89_02635, partial [Methylacidiphilaceae bacterium]|nr:hypothetical protein [Candidatus Methylacidiphilaceae bacterium]
MGESFCESRFSLRRAVLRSDCKGVRGSTWSLFCHSSVGMNVSGETIWSMVRLGGGGLGGGEEGKRWL